MFLLLRAQRIISPLRASIQISQWLKGIAGPRGREIDLAIAASELTHDAHLWTLNRADFQDIPHLVLYEPDF